MPFYGRGNGISSFFDPFIEKKIAAFKMSVEGHTRRRIQSGSKNIYWISIIS